MKRTTTLLTMALAGIAWAEPVWKQDGNRSLELVDGETVLVRFVLDCSPKDPHFEVLATNNGSNLVWVAPADHVWHYGLWFSWKKINDVNFWETNKDGEQQGKNVILDPLITSEPNAATATISYREMAHPVREGEAVLEDKVEIRITRPVGEMGVRVDWDVKTTALADVVLDRTPPPGHGTEKEKSKSYGGYGGFSWRGPKTLKQTTYLDSEGRNETEIHRKPSNWVNVNGEINKAGAGLLILNHPENPRHPPTWYVFHIHRRETLWYVNPALLQFEPLKLAKDESITHRYRVQVHNGGLDLEKCKQLAEQLVK